MPNTIITLMITAKWDEVEEFLKKLSDSDKIFQAGFNNFCYLKNKLRPYWGDSLNPNHPLTIHLLGASNLLKSFVARIQSAEIDPLIDKIISRLAQPNECKSAYQELDVYRRLMLGGLQPSFIKERKTTTPDISITVDDHKVWIEVTSINEEIENSPAPDLLYLQMELSLRRGVLIGGTVKGPMSQEDVDMLRTDAEELAIMAKEMGEIQFKNSNHWNLFAIDKTKADEVPERFRHGCLFVYDRKEPHTADLMLRIEQKMNKKYVEGEAGFIVLFDYFMDNEELMLVLNNDDDQIIQYLEIHPELLGIAVILPPGHTASFVATGDKIGKKKIFRNYVIQPDNAPEMLLVWKNPNPAVDNTRIVDAFVSIDRNQ